MSNTGRSASCAASHRGQAGRHASHNPYKKEGQAGVKSRGTKAVACGTSKKACLSRSWCNNQGQEQAGSKETCRNSSRRVDHTRSILAPTNWAKAHCKQPWSQPANSTHPRRTQVRQQFSQTHQGSTHSPPHLPSHSYPQRSLLSTSVKNQTRN